MMAAKAVNDPVRQLAAELENPPLADDLPASDPGPQDDSRPDPAPARDPKDRPKGEIWEGCPIVPLGVKGSTYYYLDAQRQIIGLTKHAQQDILGLFGHMIPQLFWRFPQYDKDGGRKSGRFDANNAAAAMMQAGGEKGLFEPEGAVRGVGAWRGSTGQLIWHQGDTLLVDGVAQKPGPFDGRIYPAYPPIPGPAPAGKYENPIPELMRVLRTWNWERPESDPFIALGMIGVQKLGGALRWRPTFWMTAAAGAGKSEFHDLIRHLHGGPKGIVQSADPTKSGITSRLGYSSIPVSLDEIEPGNERSTKESDMIQLARIAASGGQWLRGSSDQKGSGGNVCSAFLFSSIIIPGVMKAQDLQRLIRLDLNPLPRDTKPLNLREPDWQMRGSVMFRLLIDRWPTWDERLTIYRQGLAVAGVTGRDSDNWATVLAMADMMQRAELPELAEAESWGSVIAKRLVANRPDVMTDSEGMLMHLMGRTYDPFRRGEQYNIAQWIMTAAGLPGAPTALKENEHAAPHQLAKCGLRVRGAGHDAELFIANAKEIQPLSALFEGSQWAGGAWQQSARRVDGASPVPNPLTLAGITSRGHFVPFAAIPGLVAFPIDKQHPSAAIPAPDATEDFI